MPRKSAKKLRVSVPNMPASVANNRVAAELWRTLSQKLKKMEVLTESDAVALEGLCVAYARALEADEAVEQYGMVIEDRMSGTLKANPAVNMSSKAWNDVYRFAAQFGLTPSSRARVPSNGEGDSAADNDPQREAEHLLFGGRKSGKVVGSIGA